MGDLRFHKALAFSGGADSLCLLFLLQRLLLSKEDSATYFNGSPPTIVTLTIDHGLQSGSGTAASRASELVQRMSIEHQIISIPWGIYPFPPRPADGSTMEEIARDARYRLLFTAMQSRGINWLGLGHHADDQVETAVMRLSRGSGGLGLSGMRPLRRWGMGARTALAWAGLPGMSTWIARPLLP